MRHHLIFNLMICSTGLSQEVMFALQKVKIFVQAVKSVGQILTPQAPTRVTMNYRYISSAAGKVDRGFSSVAEGVSSDEGIDDN